MQNLQKTAKSEPIAVKVPPQGEGARVTVRKKREPRALPVRGFASLVKVVAKTEKRIRGYQRVPNVRSSADRVADLQKLQGALTTTTDPLIQQVLRDRISALEKVIERNSQRRVASGRKSEMERDERAGKELVAKLSEHLAGIRAILAQMEQASQTWVSHEWNGKVKK
jgi:hypothetical protein